MEPTRHNPGQRAIVDAVRARLSTDDHYEHRGIIAKRPEALPGTFELLFEAHKAIKRNGEQSTVSFDVRMSSVLSQTRLRFLTRDDEYCILGLSEGSPELSELKETTLSFAFPSTMLADSLRVKFVELWKSAQSPWEYLATFIDDSKGSQLNYSQDDVLIELGGDPTNEQFRAFILSHCDSFNALPATRFPKAGPPNATPE
jgi:hypothetical protein